MKKQYTQDQIDNFTQEELWEYLAENLGVTNSSPNDVYLTMENKDGN